MHTQPKRQSLTTQILWRVGIVSAIAILGVFVAIVAGATISLLGSYRQIETTTVQTAHNLDMSLDRY
jgi:type III secretory pathway component EscS